ncbi:MAG: hypothetical protein QHH10_05830 [Peptococcaceae bacterium]|nr:hypothetical protein [Peptococcaceae bacterium]MDH7524821.1 hypothetical protein [Peptococcaceae bacterium]
MADIELIKEKLKQLDRYCMQLSKYQGVTAEELETDQRNGWVQKYSCS